MDQGRGPCRRPFNVSCGKAGRATIKKTDDSIVDDEALGATEVAQLLRENLEQERYALETVQTIGKRISNEGIAVAA